MMKKNKLFLLVLIFLTQCSYNKNIVTNNTIAKIEKPKLVIGIVVDQMRYDYLTRFYDKYQENGFKKLMNNGFNCTNVHLNYTPTHTAVGHSSIFTGTTPNIHGIVGNRWYDKQIKSKIYCVDDPNYTTIGSKNGGSKSPHLLRVKTISDRLLIAQNNKGKAIGISLKDRGAILPVGHNATAAYWFRGKSEGKFITSSYYMSELPKWVTNFNDLKLVDHYLSKPWNTLYDINTYTESVADANEFELTLDGENKAVFPHNLPKIFKKTQNYSLIKSTPFGNNLLIDFAKATIINENLGQNNNTDFLSISFSSTDYIGHIFGVNSKEVEDVYLRLDKDLAKFIKFLDKQVGQNYTLFLTADHGALSSYNYLKSNNVKTLLFDKHDFKKYVNKLTLKHFKTSTLVEHISNYQLFFNNDELLKLNVSRNNVAKKLAAEIKNYNGIANCLTSKEILNNQFTKNILKYTQNGFHKDISGDIVYITQPNTVRYGEKGSEHSTGYSYDTHVPLLFYGVGIDKGLINRYIPIIDISPTIAKILMLNDNGNAINEVFK